MRSSNTSGEVEKNRMRVLISHCTAFFSPLAPHYLPLTPPKKEGQPSPVNETEKWSARGC